MKTERAYSLLTIKEIDEDKRELRGIATTPTTDRVGDIVEPKGAEFKLPIPFLWQHNSREPIGHVTSAKVSKDGIEIVAKLVKCDEPGLLKDRLDEAWQSIKLGLVRGLSIGFQSKESARLEDGYGYRFLKWLWLELSAVTIPANADASILSIKASDIQVMAASGRIHKGVVRLDGFSPAGVSAITKVKPAQEAIKMNIAEQIKAFEAKRAALSARLDALVEKSGEEGRTLDATEKEEYGTADTELKSIDEHLVILRAREKSQALAAAPVVATVVKDADAAGAARGGAVIFAKDNLPPGIEFARYAMCLAAAKGDTMHAVEIAKSRYPDNARIINTLKDAVAAGTTTDTTWAAPLVQYQQFVGDFVEFLRPQTIIGKFGLNGIPNLRRVPFNVSIAGQTSGGDAYWVGEGAPKPLTKFDFAPVNLRWAKVANIAVLTEELVRFSTPSAEMLVRDALAAAIMERLDRDFVDPAKAAVANVSPASITNGVTGIASSGNDSDAVRADIAALFGGYIANNMTPVNGVWIMSATTALALSLLRNPLGQQEFPDINMVGGRFAGLPVIVSQYLPSNSAGAMVILVNASDIYLADDGQVVIDASREASLQMLDNPTNNSATATPTNVVSMFQTNSIAIRAERFINWARRRPEAVAYLNAVAWGST